MSKNIITAFLFYSASFALAEELLATEDGTIFGEKNSVTDPKGNQYFSKKLDNWYRPHLRAMGEPSMFSGAGSKIATQFRFLYLPTFSKPISFRGYCADERFYIRVVRLTGKGGYEPGDVEIGVDIRISESEWNLLQDAVIRSFKATKLTEEQRSIIGGLDGSEWILEARIDGNYHYQEIWQASYYVSEDGLKVLGELEDEGVDVPILFAFVGACEMFLNLTDFALPS